MSVILHEFGLIKVLNTSYIKMHCLFCFDIIVFISKNSVADSEQHLGKHYDLHSMYGWSETEPTLRYRAVFLK